MLNPQEISHLMLCMTGSKTQDSRNLTILSFNMHNTSTCIIHMCSMHCWKLICLLYDCSSKQRDLYDETFRDLVQSVIEGFNGTIFAYGQTGTGKTFTMQGRKKLDQFWSQPFCYIWRLCYIFHSVS